VVMLGDWKWFYENVWTFSTEGGGSGEELRCRRRFDGEVVIFS
jgi:hypothetical protein